MGVGGTVKIRLTIHVEVGPDWAKTEAKNQVVRTLVAPPTKYLEPDQALVALWDDLLELLRRTIDEARGTRTSGFSMAVRLVIRAGQKAEGARKTVTAQLQGTLSTGVPAGHRLDPAEMLQSMETDLLWSLRKVLGKVQLRHPSEYR